MSVYFILNSDKTAVKVGYSNNHKKRLRQLQTGNAHKLEIFFLIEQGCMKLEKVFHDFLRSKNKHIRGEWFAYDDHVKSYLLDLANWQKDQSGNWFNEGVYHEIQHKRSWDSYNKAMLATQETS
ncbi:MAG: GIY-YIG nuclease family protein [Rickettsiales bacterium]